MAADNIQAIARVYATAIFELAWESQQTDTFRMELAELIRHLNSQAEFAVFLESPAISRDKKKQTLSRVFGDVFTELMINFLMVLADKDRLALLRPINQSYTDIEDAHAGRVKGHLRTAVPLSKNDEIRLTEQVGRALRKTVSLQTSVDPSILGGLVLTIGDTLMDGSVRSSLQRFAQQLRQTAHERLTGPLNMDVSN